MTPKHARSSTLLEGQQYPDSDDEAGDNPFIDNEMEGLVSDYD